MIFFQFSLDVLLYLLNWNDLRYCAWAFTNQLIDRAALYHLLFFAIPGECHFGDSLLPRLLLNNKYKQFYYTYIQFHKYKSMCLPLKVESHHIVNIVFTTPNWTACIQSSTNVFGSSMYLFQ